MNEKVKGTPLAQFMSYMEGKLKPKEFNEFRTKVQTELLDRAPVVAIIGKAGVGKTTTINNLFDVDDYVVEAMSFDEKGHIGDVRRGTTTAIRKRFDLKIGIGLDIIDFLVWETTFVKIRSLKRFIVRFFHSAISSFMC